MTIDRTSLVALLAVAGVVAFAIWAPRAGDRDDLGPQIERKRRSVVLITIDTTRADHIQPYSDEYVSTPTLQRLADQGMLMEAAYAVAPLTLPAHTSIHTGLYPLQTAVRNNGIHFVAPELSTLAERFAAQGYRTGAFVSASVLERRYGLDQGFDVYDDDLSKSRMRRPRMVPDRPGEFTVQSASEWLDTVAEDERFWCTSTIRTPPTTHRSRTATNTRRTPTRARSRTWMHRSVSCWPIRASTLRRVWSYR